MVRGPTSSTLTQVPDLGLARHGREGVACPCCVPKTVVSTVCASVCVFSSSADQDGITNRFGALFFIVLNTLFSKMNGLRVFAGERAIM